MPKEQEHGCVPTEVGFEQKINSRMEMRLALVEDSDLDAETKTRIKNGFAMLKEYKKEHWGIDDAFYNTIACIYDVTRGKAGEAKSLFENLRDDMWDFHKEIQG